MSDQELLADRELLSKAGNLLQIILLTEITIGYSFSLALMMTDQFQAF